MDGGSRWPVEVLRVVVVVVVRAFTQYILVICGVELEVFMVTKGDE